LIETELTRILKETDWVPCKDGIPRKPYDCDINSISSDLEYRECLALEKIDFGGSTRDILRNSEIEQEKARALGFESISEVEDFMAFKKLVGDDFIKLYLEDHNRKQFEAERIPLQNVVENASRNEIKTDRGQVDHSEQNNSSFRAAEPRYKDDLQSAIGISNDTNSGNRNS